MSIARDGTHPRAAPSVGLRARCLCCHVAAVAVALVVAGSPSSARADPDGARAVLAGAASNVAGFIVGGTMLALSHSETMNSAGWLTIESGFTVAPLAAHGVNGEWGRGAIFASVPAACMAGSATLFTVVPNTVDQGSLPQQRLMWGLFLGGQIAAVVGIIDAAFAPGRARRIYVAPAVGRHEVGFTLGGVL